MKENLAISDLALAAMISIHWPIERIQKTGGQRDYFIFLNTFETERLIESFWRGELLVEPKTYFNALKQIKARLHQG